MVAKLSVRSPVHRISAASIIHTNAWDIEMHHYLTASSREVQFAASQSLTSFGRSPDALGTVLMRAACSNNSSSATAVLHSLLALSSLHRHGVQSQAMKLKISSLKALAAASVAENSLDLELVIQHVATGMLLCSFEVHQASCTSSQWAVYLAGVKQLLSASSLEKPQEHEDLAVLLDWVYYHDVMMRFTLRHWNGEAMVLPSNTTSAWTLLCSYTQVFVEQLPKIDLKRSCISQQPSSTSALPELLSEFCELMPGQAIDDHKSILKALDWRIRTVPVLLKPDEAAKMMTIIELYRLAALVYIHRASSNLLNQESQAQRDIDEGFMLLSKMDACERQFPIFVLGCEARTDGQRKIIMDLILRTEKRVTSRSFNHVTALLHAVWAQDDLADVQINYGNKLTAVISRCAIVPSLV
ncbi:hypothetical protein KVR01_001124 [Diaporthe batatas]|uniref:uncharacterized protein n=1 Tax=Diaporthe batatas TaxID=748121 RepID=UPI001D03B70A|nr:uncharacterized protein KVR01_001124 [Diaporthe batatas]KAG8168375.1 hypothetical protein KVR01_001124 [Diaporthe batatas]